MTVSIMTLPGMASVAGLLELGVTGIRDSPRDLLVGDRVSPQGIARLRADWEPFVAAGLRYHLVTPWPRDLTGVDPDGPDWERRWRAVGQELGHSIGDLVTSWQLGNELNIYYFRAPLRTTAQVSRFIGAFGMGIRDAVPAAQLGTNAFGIDQGALSLYEAIYGKDAPLPLDWIGVDAYWGSWQPGGPDDWRRTIDRVWELGGGRPVYVCEIGFPSAGAVSAPGELLRFARGLGYQSLEQVEGDRDRLLAAAPPELAESLRSLPSESWEEDFEDSASHLLRKWRRSWGGGPQTPEKQARYFSECLSFMLGDPRIGELMLFMYRDMPRCWTCGREDCPLETSWGFVHADGRPKPVFGAVRELLEGAAR